jgi:cathepsin A (carboxypeptidase C)
MFRSLLVLSVAASALVAASPAQFPFKASGSRKTTVLEEHDGAVTIFKHDNFPTHQIRAIQPRGFCDGTVEQWSGYLDTPNNRHFYFWCAGALLKLSYRSLTAE